MRWTYLHPLAHCPHNTTHTNSSTRQRKYGNATFNPIGWRRGSRTIPSLPYSSCKRALIPTSSDDEYVRKSNNCLELIPRIELHGSRDLRNWVLIEFNWWRNYKEREVKREVTREWHRSDRDDSTSSHKITLAECNIVEMRRLFRVLSCFPWLKISQSFKWVERSFLLSLSFSLGPIEFNWVPQLSCMALAIAGIEF